MRWSACLLLVLPAAALIWLGLGDADRGPAAAGPRLAAADSGADAAACRKRRQAIGRRLRAEFGEHDFTLVCVPPFVVIGDEAPAVVRQRAQRTVGWAVRLLKRAYFDRDPDRALAVWLFADRASYRRHCRALFHTEPDTPFGFYSAEHDALIMNIATGGGTLVHEIVHPYVEANFPGCPAWFNEGLGSLYEQCGERDGRIVGFTNWRLAGLQEAIRAGELPPLTRLLATSSHQFYNRDPGTNYAQARYLLYYLQQRGKLRAFYKAFHAARRKDPTGQATLKRILDQPDLAAFQQQWEAWVLKLSFSG